VKLSSGKCGVSYYPKEFPLPKPPEIVNGNVLMAASLALSNNMGERSLGIAIMNALSWEVASESSVRFGDPLKDLEVGGKIVATVGYFHPLLGRLISAKEVRVVERKEMEGVYPPSKAKEALKGASVVLITGSALVYGGMEDYLSYSRGAEMVIVMGPTSSMLPQPFFNRGADIVAGVRITNCQKLFESDKLCKDIFDACAEKVYFKKT